MKKVKIPLLSNEAFNALLKSIITKDATAKHPHHINYPIMKKPTQQSKLNTILRKLQYYRAPTSIKNKYLTKQLYLQHIFDVSGQKESIDTLLNSDNKIKDFFLQTKMKEPKFMKIYSIYFDDSLQQKYNLTSIIKPRQLLILSNKQGHVQA